MARVLHMCGRERPTPQDKLTLMQPHRQKTARNCDLSNPDRAEVEALSEEPTSQERLRHVGKLRSGVVQNRGQGRAHQHALVTIGFFHNAVAVSRLHASGMHGLFPINFVVIVGRPAVVRGIQTDHLLVGGHAEKAHPLYDPEEWKHHTQHPACMPRSDCQINEYSFLLSMNANSHILGIVGKLPKCCLLHQKQTTPSLHAWAGPTRMSLPATWWLLSMVRLSNK
jgi:hypothetical protein